MRQRVGVLMAIVGGVLGFVALWWWALRGMSEEVATASGATAAVFVLVGLFIALFPDEP